jgi:hypothetical protein
MGIAQGLCSYDSNLYAAWKGEVGDDRLFYSVFNGTSWTGANTIPGNSGVGPSLAATSGGVIVAAWRGENLDSRLFFATYPVSTQKWSLQTQIPNVSSIIGPSLTAIDNTVYAAWIGIDNDQSMYFASLDPATGVWTTVPGISGQTSPFGPSLAALGGMLYAAWINSGGGIVYASFNPSTGSWSTPAIIQDVASSIGPTLAAVGNALYFAWKGEGTDQGMYYESYNPSTGVWSGQKTIPNFSSSMGPVISALGDNTLYAMWVGENTDQSLYYYEFNTITSQWLTQGNVPGNSGQDYLPWSLAGLGSNVNYVIYGNCGPILNLTVTITVTEPIVIADGFAYTFQLNCYSPQNQKCDYQQYTLAVVSGGISWSVDNWPAAGGKNLINFGAQLAPITTEIIPVGFTFQISLVNDKNMNVVGVNWSVTNTETSPPTVTPYSTDITKLPLINPTTGAETTNLVSSEPDVLAPIIAFQLNLVGPGVAPGTVTFGAGAGNITYSADPTTPLAPLNYVPECAEWFAGTAEQSNSCYSPMSPTQGTTITQSFGVNTGPAPTLKSGLHR